jgi:hypothetical protein
LLKSDTSEITSFDETPATMLHLVVRKPSGADLTFATHPRRLP